VTQDENPPFEVALRDQASPRCIKRLAGAFDALAVHRQRRRCEAGHLLAPPALAQVDERSSNHRGQPLGAGYVHREATAVMISIKRSGWFCWRSSLKLVAIAILSGASGLAPSTTPALAKDLNLAQMRAYSASGTHQCASEKGRSCVVTGSGFSNCNDAAITLQTRDCCPTTPSGGKSSGFTLNYCIPDRAL